jgi:predicted component of type VI protein secretion system
MTLSLSVISYAGQTPATPIAVTIGQDGGVIGRQSGCAWVLDDPEGHVSKRHCRVDFVSGRYRITDTSTNGVFLNDTTNRVGYGVSAVLQEDDRLFIGSYEIAVRLSTREPAPQQRREEPAPAPMLGDDEPVTAVPEGKSASAADHPKRPSARPPRLTRAIGKTSAMNLVQAFLEGAGLSTELFADGEPEAILMAAGHRLRELVSGLRATLALTAQIKSELGIAREAAATPTRNPLDATSNDEQALLALLMPPTEGAMAPDRAIETGFREIQTHEWALLAGARTVLAEALAPLAPEVLMNRRVEGRALLPALRKAQYWDLFEAEFKKLSALAEDDPRGPLARALSRAYEDRERDR